jgi:hypothetical protein
VQTHRASSQKPQTPLLFVSQIWIDGLQRQKPLTSVGGENDAEIYDSAIEAIGDAIADSGQMNSKLMTILQDIRDGNPYK